MPEPKAGSLGQLALWRGSQVDVVCAATWHASSASEKSVERDIVQCFGCDVGSER